MNPTLAASPRARHATVVAERRVGASPSRVFRAFADAAERRLWDVPGQGWVIAELEQDFRVGGRERIRFGPPDDPRYMSEGRFLAIEPDRRIVSAGTMHDGVVPATATLATIEIVPDGTGSLVVLTDQSAYWGAEEDGDRRAGWGRILDNLAAHLDAG